jgi:glycosyltransferase involved in cell wall biosynthesis
MSKKIGIDGRLWNESGVGRYIRNLVNGIDLLKTTDSYIIFLTKDTYNKVTFKNPNIKKVISTSHWHTLSEQWKFKEEIERENVDLMHFTYFSYPVFYNRPFVITIHDLIIDHFPTGVASSLPVPVYKLKHFGYKKIIASSVRDAKKIIVPSTATKKEIIDHYKANPSKIEVIYEGFDDAISGSGNTKLITTNKYILYVGNAYPHKNITVLFEAFSLLRKRNPDIELICIGREDFFYKRLKKAPGIHFLHNVDDKELFDYYKSASLFVMPSLMEGFGLPLLEAMSLSCPVISSNTPALKEIGGDAVLYFDPKNHKELEEKIHLLLTDQKRRSELVDKALIGAKQTPMLIPFCHPLSIDGMSVTFEKEPGSIIVRVEAKL